MRLKGKTAIVTGGASGFGAGIVAKFVAEGARVMIADINGDAAQEMAQQIGANAIAQTVDVANAASVQAMADAALTAFGHLDILINNAGISHMPTPLEDVSEDDFDRVFNVNMKSVYLTARALVPHMKSRKQGVILKPAGPLQVARSPAGAGRREPAMEGRWEYT